MKTVIVAAALLLGPIAPALAANLSKADCEATWNDARSKGSDMEAELAKPYVIDFKAVDANSDGGAARAFMVTEQRPLAYEVLFSKTYFALEETGIGYPSLTPKQSSLIALLDPSTYTLVEA